MYNCNISVSVHEKLKIEDINYIAEKKKKDYLLVLSSLFKYVEK